MKRFLLFFIFIFVFVFVPDVFAFDVSDSDDLRFFIRSNTGSKLDVSSSVVKLKDDLVVSSFVSFDLDNDLLFDLDGHKLIFKDRGSFYFNGGNISIVNGFFKSSKGSFVVNDGSLTLDNLSVKTKGYSFYVSGGNLVINSGDYFSSLGVINIDNGFLLVNDGSFSSRNYPIVVNGGKTVLKHGSFYGDFGPVLLNNFNNFSMSDVKLITNSDKKLDVSNLFITNTLYKINRSCNMCFYNEL